MARLTSKKSRAQEADTDPPKKAGTRKQEVSKPIRDEATEKRDAARENDIDEGNTADFSDSSGASDTSDHERAGLGAEESPEDTFEYELLQPGSIVNGKVYPDPDAEDGKSMIVEMTKVQARLHRDHGVPLRHTNEEGNLDEDKRF